MDKFISKIESVLVPIASKISNNKYISSISNGFTMCLPVFIVGAIFSLLSGLQLGGYQDFIINLGIKEFLLIIPQITTNLLSLYVVFFIAYSLTEKNDLKKDSSFCGLLALVAFFIITPTGMITTEGVSVKALPFSWLGSQGLFMAIIVALITGAIYNTIIKRNWILKMPDGVPPTISKSFAALIPGFVISIVFLLITIIFSKTSAGNPHDFLYNILKSPLQALSGSVWTYLLLAFLAGLLWFFGIHGAMVTSPFQIMLFMDAGVANEAAYAAGQELPNILTNTTRSVTLLGGIGATLSLVLLMLFFAKSKRYKSLGKLSFLPGLCGINEPIMFGFPLVLNPIMFIPFITVPIINGIILYFTMNIGLVGKPRIANAVFGMPVFLDGFVISGFGAVVLQIILLVIDMLIYLPFFKIQDNQALKEEESEVNL